MWKGRPGRTQAKGRNVADSTGCDVQSLPATPTTPTIVAEMSGNEDSKDSCWPRKGSKSSDNTTLSGATISPSTSDPPTPITISHRGSRSLHPENSLPSFIAALSNPHTTALETDIHLTLDNQIVLSHDPTLTRLFGKPLIISQNPLSTLAPLRSLSPPHTPLATLSDLLTLLSQPAHAHIFLLLDIKITAGPPLPVLTALAHTLTTHPAPWSHRIKLGLWGYSYVPFARHLLPSYTIVHIGISIPYARLFLERGIYEFNLLEAIVTSSSGLKFLADVRAKGGRCYVWTVNDTQGMRYCIKAGVDGICTDRAELLDEERRGYVEMVRRGGVDSGYGRLGWGKWGEVLLVRGLAWGASKLWRGWTRRGVMWVGDEVLREVGKVAATGNPAGCVVAEVAEEGRGLLEGWDGREGQDGRRS